MTAPAPITHAASIDEDFRTTVASKNLASKKLFSHTTPHAAYLLDLGVGNCEIRLAPRPQPPHCGTYITALLRLNGHTSRNQFIASWIPNPLPPPTAPPL
jgi:hypothetical protein